MAWAVVAVILSSDGCVLTFGGRFVTLLFSSDFKVREGHICMHLNARLEEICSGGSLYAKVGMPIQS